MNNPYEPPGPAPARVAPRGPRPRLLPHVTIAMVACGPAGFLSDEGRRPELLVPNAIVLAFSYFALWHFWNGKNWARWLVMLSSGLALLNLLLVPRFSPAAAAVIVMEGALGVFLLVWLNLASTKAYFARLRRPSASVTPVVRPPNSLRSPGGLEFVPAKT